MTSESLSAAIARLDAFPLPAVLRFDRASELVGHVAVLPSAFNPPTEAHLALLEAARRGSGATVGLALLSTRNVDKPLGGAPLYHRVGMLLALCADAPRLAVAATNAARIVEQARALRRAFPSARFDFVVGSDTLVRLFDERYYPADEMVPLLDELFRWHRVFVAVRSPAPAETLTDLLGSRAARWADGVTPLETPPWVAAISSTEARMAVAKGLPAAGTPAVVARYIARHRLYRAALR